MGRFFTPIPVYLVTLIASRPGREELMKAVKPNDIFMKWRDEIIKFIAVSLLPITLFFRRDFDYYLHPAALYLFYMVLSGVSVITLMTIFHSIFKVRQFGRKRDLYWIIFPSLLLFSCVLFGHKISVLREIVIFRIHREDFSELVMLADSAPPEKGIEDTYIEIPKQHQEWTGQRYISVFKDAENSLRLVALLSRPDTYFTYLPNHKQLPEDVLNFQYGYRVDCFYELAEYWYICSC
jgi:hypothetical protein